MERLLRYLNRPRAGCPLGTGITCALLLVGGCQDGSQVAQQGTDSARSAIPGHFQAPDGIRPVGHLATHLEISEPEENVITNPYADLNRFPPVPRKAAVKAPASQTPAPQVPASETPALDGLGLPFRLDKSAQSAQTEKPATTPGLNRVEAPPQLNASRPATPPPVSEQASAAKPTAKQFLAALAPNENRPGEAFPDQTFPDLEPPRQSSQQSPTPARVEPASDQVKPIMPNAVRRSEAPFVEQPTPAHSPTYTPARDLAGPPSSLAHFRGMKPNVAELEPPVTPPASSPATTLQIPPSEATIPHLPPPPNILPPQFKPAPAPHLEPTAEERAVLAVRERMNSLVDQGLILAQRGAYFSARAEFIQALRLATQTLDTAQGTHRHSAALAEAIVAMDEAGDFIPSGARLEADVDLAMVVCSHRTKILHQADLRELTALTAAQRYFAFAQQKLALACGGLPEASRALVGLGRIQEHLYETGGDGRSLIGPRSMALYQTALVVNDTNYEAANELGVMLARYGQFGDAKRALLQGAEATSRPELWANLAAIHQRLGETHLAHQARLEAEHARQLAQSQNAAQNKLDAVRWVSPEEMAAHGRRDGGLKQAQPPAETPAPVAQKRPATSWWSR